LHKVQVDVAQHRIRLRFNDANVVDATWTNSDNFLMHERLYQFWCLADCFYSIVVGWIKRWRWQKGCLMIYTTIKRTLTVIRA